MDFVHAREQMSAGDVAVVDCSHQCNVMLMNDANFNRYRSGDAHEYYGGFFERLPARIAAPGNGYWNIVLDLGGGSASITHSIQIYRA